MTELPSKGSDHPLAVFSRGQELAKAPVEDGTPSQFPQCFFPSVASRIKRELGLFIYPIKNFLERKKVWHRLKDIGARTELLDLPRVLSWGQKGFSTEIFLARIGRFLRPESTIVCFGCGMGYEFFPIARFLKPTSIIGLEFFNYSRAWDFVKTRMQAKGIHVEFRQADLRKSVENLARPCDLLVSFAVLEHLRDMEQTFENLRPLLKDDGLFASEWGPMWYSYSGDHIAAELGFEFGFEQVLRSPEHYLEWYKAHPRNVPTVEKGEPTWLELGLHNYARYEEYLSAVKRIFGEPVHLHWQLSQEAFRWRTLYRDKWDQMLMTNPRLQPLDLVLSGAAVIARVKN